MVRLRQACLARSARRAAASSEIEGLSFHDCISCHFDVLDDIIVTSDLTPVKCRGVIWTSDCQGERVPSPLCQLSPRYGPATSAIVAGFRVRGPVLTTIADGFRRRPAAGQHVSGAHRECGGTDGGRESGGSADVVGRRSRPTAEQWPVLDAPEVHVAASERDLPEHQPWPPRTGQSWGSGAGFRRGARSSRPGPVIRRREGASAEVSAAVRRLGIRLATSSVRAATVPNWAYRSSAVTDHRVECVHRAIADQSRQPRHGTPDERGDYGIRRILGDGLDRGPGQLTCLQCGGIAATQTGEPFSRGIEVAASPGRWPGDRPRRRRDLPPSTVHVVTATSTARATGRRRVANVTADAARTGTPMAIAACRAPAVRYGAYVRRSSQDAKVPNPATGCSRLGSPKRTSRP